MKKFFASLLALSFVFLSGCGEKSTGPDPEPVLQALKTENYEALSDLVHPTRGVLFSPYGYVNKREAQIMGRDSITKLPESTRVFTWGAWDGSGEPMEMTWDEYYDRFVWDQDYTQAPQQSANERLGNGNTLNNISSVWPNGQYFEYHFPGFEEQYAGMDWCSLRLVFENYKGTWYLVGVLHDGWTI